MKKLLSFVIAFAIVMQSFGMGISTKANAAKLPKLNKTSVTLTVGSSYKLKVKNSKKKAKWKSSSKSVATVNKSGKITAINEGKATITATVAKKKLKCKVVVINSNNSSADAMTTEATQTASDENIGLSDVEKLRKIIKRQKELGADVDEDIFNSDQYVWGRLLYDGKAVSTKYPNESDNPVLMELNWSGRKLGEELNISFEHLQKVNVSGNALSKLQAGSCERMLRLDCSNNHLVELDVTNCKVLNTLDCSSNELVSINVDNCERLDYLHCENNKLEGLHLENTSIDKVYCYNNKLGMSIVVPYCYLVTVLCDSNANLLDAENVPITDLKTGMDLVHTDYGMNKYYYLGEKTSDYEKRWVSNKVNKAGEKMLP